MLAAMFLASAPSRNSSTYFIANISFWGGSADIREQGQRLRRLFRVELLQREPDMHDHIITHRDILDQRQRYFLAYTAEIDDGAVSGNEFFYAGGNRETHAFIQSQKEIGRA